MTAEAPEPGRYPYGPGSQPASAEQKNPLGLLALILGAVPTLIGLIFTALTPSLVSSGGVSALQVSGLIQAVFVVVIGATALVLGIIGLTRRGRPRAAAAAGTALGAAALVSALGGALVNFAASAFYSF